MSRSEAEKDLDFIGFIIFENKLKPSTAGIINELKDSNIRTLMVTGDNILTAISVARECNLLSPGAHCFVPHFTRGKYTAMPHMPILTFIGDSLDPNAEIQWDSIENSLYKLDGNTLVVSVGVTRVMISTNMYLKPLLPPPEMETSLPYHITHLRNYSLAVTGEVFRWIIDYAPAQVLRRVSLSLC